MSKKSKSTPEQQAPAAVRSRDGVCGVELIAAERERQLAQEGWTPEHDDKHKGWQLSLAAVSYIYAGAGPDEWALERGEKQQPCHDWPWAKKWWKPSDDNIRNLVKAGALIAAEIDRLQRAKIKAEQCPMCRGEGSITQVVRGVRSVNPCVKCRATGKRKPHTDQAQARGRQP